MRVIGLTGGIATGKSTVAAMLARRGAVVIDADRLAREAVAPGTQGLAKVVAAFGPDIVAADGGLDRARLGAIVFADIGQRRRLEAITHPRIRELMAREIAAAMEADPPVIAVDIPLLYETGRDAEFPEVLLVYADARTQMTRLRERDGLDGAAAQQRLDAQLPIDEKRSRATWVIDNSGSREATEDQVDGVWESLSAVGNA